jgi:acyl carrier protein
MSASQRASRTEIRGLVAERLHTWYGVPLDELPDDRPLAEAGLTSRDALALTAALSELAGRRLPDTLLWDAPTIEALVRRLGEAAPRADGGRGGIGRAGHVTHSPQRARHAGNGQVGLGQAVAGGCGVPGSVPGACRCGVGWGRGCAGTSQPAAVRAYGCGL